MRLTFWQNQLTLHQSALLRSLSQAPGIEVTLVVESVTSERRVQLGWHEPDYGRTRIVVAPSQSDVERLIAGTTNDSVHIFSGLHAYPLAEAAFFQCMRLGFCCGIFSEAAEQRGWKGVARLARGRVDAYRYAKHISFVLAIGQFGVNWFRKIGFRDDGLYPFAYFLERPSKRTARPGELRDHGGKLKLIFIGHLNKGKRVDLLLQALQGLSSVARWQLRLIGDGPERHRLTAMATGLGLAHNVEFTGVQENRIAMEALERSDLLILPSRYDGWGAVVSEALMRGVPVICSDACGARDLISSPGRGSVFRAESVQSLRVALAAAVECGPVNSTQSRLIQEWTKCIEGDSGARYLLNIIAHTRKLAERPRAPWLASAAMQDADIFKGVQ